MRLGLLILAALLLAGCTQNHTSVSYSNTSANQSFGQAASGKPGEPGFSPLHLTHDFSGGTDETRNLTIYASWGPLNLKAYVDGPSGAPVCSGSFSIKIVGPDGKVVTTSASSSQLQTGAPHCQNFAEMNDASLMPGNWSVTFHGSGTGTGVFDLSKP
ncbi:MAG: hypothetical protein QOE90_1506 [Thermoplasmata archaeon]|jgi:hypothetical protein|nr:hypothetical protein [Thermoplasmata archaeon]